MTALSSHLQRLILWLERTGGKLPSHDVRIVEVNTCQVRLTNGKYYVRKHDLRLPSQYEGRFDELMQTGYPWINLSCYGVCDDFLIVAVEVPGLSVPVPFASSPAQGSTRPSHITSVNLSGPQLRVREQEWVVDSVLTIE